MPLQELYRAQDHGKLKVSLDVLNKRCVFLILSYNLFISIGCCFVMIDRADNSYCHGKDMYLVKNLQSLPDYE